MLVCYTKVCYVHAVMQPRLSFLQHLPATANSGLTKEKGAIFTFRPLFASIRQTRLISAKLNTSDKNFDIEGKRTMLPSIGTRWREDEEE